MGRKSLPKAATTMTAPTVRIYTLEVSLLRAAAVKTSGEVLRTIQIRGDQTLAVLHQIVCEAFCRDSEQQYEFQFGTAPMDPEGPRYVLAGAFEVSVADGTPAAGCVDNTGLDTLKLKVGQRFTYWIDCGDDWWHQVHVTKIENKVPRGKYPKITKRVGEIPTRSQDNAAAGATVPNVVDSGTAADAAYLVGELHLSKGDKQKAIEAFTRSIEECPTADAYEGRARAYRALADDDERTARALQ